MVKYVFFGQSSCPKKKFLLLILLCSLVLVSPLAVSADGTQPTTVVIPINMAFPLLPTQMIIFDNSGTKAEYVVICESGSNGIVGIIRVNARD